MADCERGLMAGGVLAGDLERAACIAWKFGLLGDPILVLELSGIGDLVL